MTGQEHNPVFEQWLAAYGNHLEQVAQGASRADDNDEQVLTTRSTSNDWPRKD